MADSGSVWGLCQVPCSPPAGKPDNKGRDRRRAGAVPFGNPPPPSTAFATAARAPQSANRADVAVARPSQLLLPRRHEGANRRTTMDSGSMKIVYVITERGGKSYWNRIGVAFVNKDGSINVKLEAAPVTGEMQIRDYVPREETAGPGLRRTRSNGHEGEDTLADFA
jgi:hypothetical protein